MKSTSQAQIIPTSKPCSCGSVVFEKVTEMRGYVVDIVTITPKGLKTKRAANKIRVEREPGSVKCSGCGKRIRLSESKADSVPMATKSDTASVNPKSSS